MSLVFASVSAEASQTKPTLDRSDSKRESKQTAKVLQLAESNLTINEHTHTHTQKQERTLMMGEVAHGDRALH